MPDTNDSTKDRRTPNLNPSLPSRIWRWITSTLASLRRGFQSVIRLFKNKNVVDQEKPKTSELQSSSLGSSFSQSEGKDVVKEDGLLLVQQKMEQQRQQQQRKLAYEKLITQQKKEQQLRQEQRKREAAQRLADIKKEAEKESEKAAQAPVKEKTEEQKPAETIEQPNIAAPSILPVRTLEEEATAKKITELFYKVDEITVPLVQWAHIGVGLRYAGAVSPEVLKVIEEGRTAIRSASSVVRGNENLLSLTIQSMLEGYLNTLASSMSSLKEKPGGFLVVIYDRKNLQRITDIIKNLRDAKIAIERAKEMTAQCPSTVVDEQVSSVEKKMQDISKEKSYTKIEETLITELQALYSSLNRSLEKIEAENPGKFLAKPGF